MIGFDTAAYSGPNLQFTLDEWAAGRLPLWNDRIFGGVAHLGNSQTGSLYPLKLLVAPFDTGRAMNLLVAGHIIAFCLGLLWVARRLALAPPAGFVVAVGGAASGAAMIKTTQFEQYLVLAWAPFLLVAIHAVLTSARPWRAVPFAASAAAMSFLAGHPQITYLLVALAVLWTIGLLASSRDVTGLAPLAAAGGLAAAICSLQLFATVHATAISAVGADRTIDRIDQDWLITPFRTPRILFGTVLDQNPAAFAGTFESTSFVGIALSALAVVGLVAGWRNPDRRPLTVALALAAVGSLVAALGPRTIVFRAAYRLVPGFDLARVPARWMVVFVLAIVLLGGFGIDAIVARRVGRAELVALLGVAALLSLGAVTGRFGADGRPMAVAIWIVTALVVFALVGTSMLTGRRAWLSAAVPVALAAVVLAELATGWVHGGALRPRAAGRIDGFTQATTEYLADTAGWTVAFTDDGYGDPRVAVTGLRPNANVFNDVRSIDGYDGGVQVTTRWLDLVLRGGDGQEFNLPLRNQLVIPLDPEAMARLNVRHVLIDLDRDWEQHVAEWSGPMISDDRYAVWENPAWSSEATLWFDAELVADDAAAARALRDLDRLGTTVLVEDATLAAVDCAGGCAPSSVELDRIDARHLRATTGSDRPGILSVGSQYDSGWKVTIDGEEASAFPADGFLLAVEVPAGEHLVELRYRPDWVLWGGLLSIVGIAATLGLLVTEDRYHRRDARRDAVHHG